MMLGGNSASNKRNIEVYRLFQSKMMDYNKKFYIFMKKLQFSLISGTCLHLHGLCLKARHKTNIENYQSTLLKRIVVFGRKYIVCE